MSATTDDYLRIKKSYPEYLLFYRLGEFYELYFADAKIAAKELLIILNQKSGIARCGFPAKSLSNNANKLLKAGYKIVIAEQILDNRNSKFIRKVTKILTPSTVIDEDLSTEESSILLAIALQDSNLDLCWGDIILGEFYIDNIDYDQLESYLTFISPKEILIEKNLGDNFKLVLERHKSCISHYELSGDNLKNTFTIISKYRNSALKYLIDYVGEIHHIADFNSWQITSYQNNQFLKLDKNTIENLELINSRSKEKNTSLISIIDKTASSLGKKLLRQSLQFPLSNIYKINRRLETVKFFINEEKLRNKIIEKLQLFPDLEKIIGRIFLSKKISARNLILILDSIQIIAEIAELLSLQSSRNSSTLILSKIATELICDFSLINKLNVALDKEAIINDNNGFFIKENFDARLDLLRQKRQFIITKIAELETKYQKETGIENLKIEFSNNLGYFIEVKSSLSSKLAGLKHFEIRQNLANHVRFSNADLKKYELEIADLNNKILILELEILDGLAEQVLFKLDHIKNSIKLIALLDLLSSFAVLALENNYSYPQFCLEQKLEIKNGRNPVVEKFRGNFIKNHCILNEQQRIWLISGANMAGKSTFLRQNALIVIMAHIGSYVPADEVRIGVIKQIFTRIGLADNLAKHQSSFMLEMSEIANILIHADKNSLIVIDEIGNSTIGKYGVALAYGIINYLHDYNSSLALITTHHQQLCAIVEYLRALRNYQMIAQTKNQDIEFSYKIMPGIAFDILSIDVAKMAKLPDEVIKLAKNIIDKFYKEQ